MNNHNTLSIRLMPGGFCFSIADSEPQFVNIFPGADYEKRLEDAILNLNINVGDDDVDCCVETARLSLSPTSCDESVAEKMFQLTLRDSESPEKILHEVCKSGDIRISFGINRNLYNFLIRTYQYINFRHTIIEVIDAEMTKIHAGENWMTALVTQSSMFLLVYKGRKLQNANCFETMVTQNRIYHVLNTWTMLGLDVLLDTLYIIGLENNVKKLKNAISKYIKLCE